MPRNICSGNINKHVLAKTVPVNKELLTKTVRAYAELLNGTIRVNKELLTRKVPINNLFLKKGLQKVKYFIFEASPFIYNNYFL